MPLPPAVPPRALPGPVATNALVHRGGHWEISFGDIHGIVEDCRGLHYIALLIRDTASQKGPIHAKELVALVTGQPTGAIELDAPDRVLDDVAKAQLAARVEEIAAERRSASDLEDYSRLAELEEEYDRIAEELSRAATGKNRRGAGTFTHASEKARKAVGKAIAEAIARVAGNPDLAPLAHHLALSIRKGQWLSYGDSRNWVVDLPLPRK